ncbi:MAG: GspE/PulE family protein [Bacteriovoracaceae bacterium]|nr:GspE/PulE family protein [Bacteriovoracaceae bacterium]
MSFALPIQSHDRAFTLRDALVPLIKSGLVEAQEAEKWLKLWSRSGEHPLTLLADVTIPDRRHPGKNVTFDDLANIIAKSCNLQYLRVDPVKVNLEVVGTLIPHAYAERLGIVAVEMSEDKVVVVTAEPFVTSWVDEISAQTKRKVELRLGSPRQIKHLLNEIFVVQKAFKAFAREQGKTGAERMKLLRQGKTGELDQLLEKSKGRNLSAQDSHVAKIVDWLLNFALLERASDIHLEPKRGLGQVRFRIDGELRTVYRLDHDALLMIISRFKILGDMKLDEKRKPQDGGIKRTMDNGKQVEMRLSTMPTSHGEKLVVRIFDKNVAGQDLSFIGFLPEDLALWEDMIHQSQGLILVTGPTGSGKTTTLYTTLNKVATPDVNVCTAEDPVEMEVDSFNQVQVNPQIGLTFAECIRSFLRQDPDIIMVGEIRDLETGEMAIQSSLTGHLVFSTLHTNGALATIQRLVDLGLQTFLINSSLLGILAQRLVRRLCPHCKEEVPTDKHKWETLMDGEKLAMPKTVFEARGCEECKHTGYLGRMCIYELVKFDDKLKKQIHQKVEIMELREKTRGLFSPLRINGARKIISGDTTLDEVLKVAY